MVGKPCKVHALASTLQKYLKDSGGRTIGQEPQKPSPTEGETAELCEKESKASKTFKLAFLQHGGKGLLSGRRSIHRWWRITLAPQAPL